MLKWYFTRYIHVFRHVWHRTVSPGTNQVYVRVMHVTSEITAVRILVNGQLVETVHDSKTEPLTEIVEGATDKVIELLAQAKERS